MHNSIKLLASMRDRIATGIGLYSFTQQPVHVPVGGNCPLYGLLVFVVVLFAQVG